MRLSWSPHLVAEPDDVPAAGRSPPVSPSVVAMILMIQKTSVSSGTLPRASFVVLPDSSFFRFFHAAPSSGV